MADTKITGLQPPQGGYPVVPSTDVLPIVVTADPGMAASGSTRKVTVNQLLGAGGTATLASATITGDLTVDTNVLKVDSTGNNVGIGRTPSGYTLDITTTGNALRIERSGVEMGGYISSNIPFWGSITNSPFVLMTNGSEKARLDASGNLGLGVTPSAWGGLGSGPGVFQLGNVGCSIFGGGTGWSTSNYLYINNNAYYNTTGTGSFKYFRANAAAQYKQQDNSHQWLISSNPPVADAAITFTQAMTLTSGGDLLVGTTSGTLTSAGRGNISLNGSTDSIFVLQNAASTAGYLYAGSTKVELDAAGSRFIQINTNGTERARIKSTGQVRFYPLAADPSGAEAGDVYYNSTSNKLKCYNGTIWNDLF